MVKVKPFAAIRPPKAIAKEVSARPYDVMNSAEAKAEAGEKSLLHITKPEIDFEPIAGEHEQRTYDKAVANYKLWKEKGLNITFRGVCGGAHSIGWSEVLDETIAFFASVK